MQSSDVSSRIHFEDSSVVSWCRPPNKGCSVDKSAGTLDKKVIWLPSIYQDKTMEYRKVPCCVRPEHNPVAFGSSTPSCSIKVPVVAHEHRCPRVCSIRALE